MRGTRWRCRQGNGSAPPPGPLPPPQVPPPDQRSPASPPDPLPRRGPQPRTASRGAPKRSSRTLGAFCALPVWDRCVPPPKHAAVRTRACKEQGSKCAHPAPWQGKETPGKHRGHQGLLPPKRSAVAPPGPGAWGFLGSPVPHLVRGTRPVSCCALNFSTTALYKAHGPPQGISSEKLSYSRNTKNKENQVVLSPMDGAAGDEE